MTRPYTTHALLVKRRQMAVLVAVRRAELRGERSGRHREAAKISGPAVPDRKDPRFLVCRIGPRASPTRPGDRSRYRQGCRSPRISLDRLTSGRWVSSTTRSGTTPRTPSGPRCGSATSERGDLLSLHRHAVVPAVRRPADYRPDREPRGMTVAKVDTAKISKGSDGDNEGRCDGVGRGDRRAARSVATGAPVKPG